MIHTGYDPALVALSIAIAVFASYVALDLGERTLAERTPGATAGPRWAWVAGAAFAMGGGIWAMHFVGMLAFEMGMPAAYDLGLTLLSLALAIGATGAAFATVSLRGARGPAILVGGPLMGVGVAGMHYTGMAGMQVPGNLAFDPGVVALSVLIAVTAATAALWLTFRRNGIGKKLVAAGVMGAAVAGMHYTGMAAATFTADAAGAPHAHAAGLGMGQQNLALAIAGATFLILFLGVLASSVDQSRVQAELGRSEERFRAAVRAVRGVIWTNDAAGRMAGEQPAWAALTGQDQAAYQGFGWADAVHPDDRQATIDAWNETLRAKRVFVHEHRVRDREGAWRTFAIRAVPILAHDGTIREWVGVHTDITEQRAVEAERQAGEERFRAAVRAVQGIVWTVDAEGRFVREQRGWEAITGQSFAEHAGTGWTAAIHPDDLAPTLAAWEAAMGAGEPYAAEHRLRAGDGTWRHYAVRALPRRDPSGAIQEWVGVHTDITEQREAEAELRESNEEIQRYAYIVSHDLRAPLVNVMGFTSELEEARADIRAALGGSGQAARIDADLGEALGFIRAAVTRMEGLIAAILKLSREGRRRFDPQPLDMSALMRGLADAQAHQTEAQGARVAIAPDLPAITADRLAVEQIFGNLLDNAVKYLDRDRPGLIEVSGQGGARRVRFTVRDNGRGIAPRDHARVFELFRRSGVQDQPGEGIGLAHVKALVRALGGRIEMRSDLGVGTTFVVTLPRDAAIGRAAIDAPIRQAAE